MAVKTLSQITPAAVPADTATQLVGVQGGTTDLLFSKAQLGILPPVTANQTLYVSTTGSDSNPGTIGSPFATIQHAADVASLFDFQGAYRVIINVADGTYNITTPINLWVLRKPNINTDSRLLGNTTTPANCVIVDANSTGIFQLSGTDCIWDVGGFKLDTSQFGFACSSGANLQVAGPLVFDDHTASGSLTPFEATNLASIGIVFQTVTIVPSTMGTMFIGNVYAFFTVFGATFTLPVALTLSLWANLISFSNLKFQSNTVTNSGGITGTSLGMTTYSSASSANGAFSDFPGSAPSGTQWDVTCSLDKAADQNRFLAHPPIAGVPTTADLAPFTWAVFKDSSGGGVYVAYNDAGTIKKVALV